MSTAKVYGSYTKILSDQRQDWKRRHPNKKPTDAEEKQIKSRARLEVREMFPISADTLRKLIGRQRRARNSG